MVYINHERSASIPGAGDREAPMEGEPLEKAKAGDKLVCAECGVELEVTRAAVVMTAR